MILLCLESFIAIAARLKPSFSEKLINDYKDHITKSLLRDHLYAQKVGTNVLYFTIVKFVLNRLRKYYEKISLYFSQLCTHGDKTPKQRFDFVCIR